MIHELKIEPNYLQNLLDGKKKAEIRFNDRDYQVGDELLFKTADAILSFRVTHIHSGYGLDNGFVILSIEKVK